MQITEQNNKVKIDGIIIPGFITEEICDVCSEKIVYNDASDAKFCPQCNKWLESKCNDPECNYCKNRPKKPL